MAPRRRIFAACCRGIRRSSCWCASANTRPAAIHWRTKRCARSDRSESSCVSRAARSRPSRPRCSAYGPSQHEPHHRSPRSDAMLIDEVDAAASTVEHANAGENFAAALDDAKTTHPDTSPPSHPGHSGSGGILGGLWHDAVSGVSSAYNTVNGAMHSAGHALDNVAQSGISLGTGLVRDIAGNGAANVFHGAAEGLRQTAKDTAGFAYGLGEGGVEALGGMAKGVGDGYRFATDGNFRSSVMHGAENLVTHIAQDPIGSAKALGS